MSATERLRALLDERGACVRKYEDTRCYDDLEAVFYDSNICEHYEEDR